MNKDNTKAALSAQEIKESNRKNAVERLINIKDNTKLESESRIVVAIVKEKTEGILVLSALSIRHLLHGFHMIVDGDKTAVKEEFVTTMSKLSIMLTEMTDTFMRPATKEIHNYDTYTFQSSFTRGEVMTLRTAIERKLSHCEIEKDLESDNFNASSYVEMKLLLIDLRDWLAVSTLMLANDQSEAHNF